MSHIKPRAEILPMLEKPKVPFVIPRTAGAHGAAIGKEKEGAGVRTEEWERRTLGEVKRDSPVNLLPIKVETKGQRSQESWRCVWGGGQKWGQSGQVSLASTRQCSRVRPTPK
ncbi:hypothetical protein BDK51DRAFT_29599 [Blyttiomyces helicus]|uniref:Uncharacterized protein n=1 Tax=Blyttiomyces helicus TaxID=388810 RepID=A0A4P9WI54_9FUNG|nr:hypothetical protein BDK51DRAFT_29599 [Blyttiomyces helicus]|eukprot:RKO90800.1 hypothetical protein BDK51DRAFT_29599 [Blyttiomyces helicus]